LKDLDKHLENFVSACTKNGIQVHWADSGKDAQKIICDLVAEKGTVVKSKSMATEEIHLNAALAARGIRVVETDVGEWVIQQTKEMPAHLIAPALHKTREDYAQVLKSGFGRDVPLEPRAIANEIRDVLRADFLDAGAGISGVNFGIAETGTIIVVTNEGNACLVTSSPRIHVALMGIEKVVATLDDAVALLRVLARSAVGAKSTSYVSFIQGPRRPDEVDGPDEVHVVLLDNGRTNYLGNEMWESLLCIRCGACLNACPVYRRIGGQAYNSAYQGPIGLLATAMVRPDELEVARDLPHASSLCGACHEICPVRIDIPRMIIALRRRAVASKKARFLERLLYAAAAAVLKRPKLYRWMLGSAGLLARITRRRYMRLPFSQTIVPMAAPQSFRAWWHEHAKLEDQ
jgi:L-lactate dehydrogenase complex protein LldF